MPFDCVPPNLLHTDTEDDLIVIRFELSGLDGEKGLLAYMNVFAVSGSVPAKYNLVRITEVRACAEPQGAFCDFVEWGLFSPCAGLAFEARGWLLVLHVPTAVGACAHYGHVLHAAPRGACCEEVSTRPSLSCTD